MDLVAPLSFWSTATTEPTLSEQLIQPVPVEETADFPECDYIKSPTNLFKAIEAKLWSEVHHFLLSGFWRGVRDPDEKTPSSQVCTWVTKYEASSDGGDECGKWTQLPIHAALIFGAPDDVIRLLLKICPGSARCANEQRMLPLHLAFQHGASDTVVGMLLDLFPVAVGVRDFEGRLPQECALNGPHAQRSEIIQAILNKDKKTWEKKRAKLQAQQKRQREVISRTKSSLRSKMEQISNLNTEVDLIKWREDQTKKTLLTLVSELKDINGWYQLQEATASKEEIVEDLTTKLASLQQVAESLVAEAARHESDSPPLVGNDSRRELFGNISSIGSCKTDADVENESVSEFSALTKNSCYEDDIHMNPYIVFLGSQDGPSHVSDASEKSNARKAKAEAKHTSTATKDPPSSTTGNADQISLLKNKALNSHQRSTESNAILGGPLPLAKSESLAGRQKSPHETHQRTVSMTRTESNASNEGSISSHLTEVTGTRSNSFWNAATSDSNTLATKTQATAPGVENHEASSVARSTVPSYCTSRKDASPHEQDPLAFASANTSPSGEERRIPPSCDVSIRGISNNDGLLDDADKVEKSEVINEEILSQIALAVSSGPSNFKSPSIDLHAKQEESEAAKLDETDRTTPEEPSDLIAAKSVLPHLSQPAPGNVSRKRGSLLKSLKRVSRKLSAPNLVKQNNSSKAQSGDEIVHCSTSERVREMSPGSTASDRVVMPANTDHTISKTETIGLQRALDSASSVGDPASSLHSSTKEANEVPVTGGSANEQDGETPKDLQMNDILEGEIGTAGTKSPEDELAPIALAYSEAEREEIVLALSKDTDHADTETPEEKVTRGAVFDSLMSIGNFSRCAQCGFFDQFSLTNDEQEVKDSGSVSGSRSNDEPKHQGNKPTAAPTNGNSSTAEEGLMQAKQRDDGFASLLSIGKLSYRAQWAFFNPFSLNNDEQKVNESASVKGHQSNGEAKCQQNSSTAAPSVGSDDTAEEGYVHAQQQGDGMVDVAVPYTASLDAKDSTSKGGVAVEENTIGQDIERPAGSPVSLQNEEVSMQETPNQLNVQDLRVISTEDCSGAARGDVEHNEVENQVEDESAIEVVDVCPESVEVAPESWDGTKSIQVDSEGVVASVLPSQEKNAIVPEPGPKPQPEDEEFNGDSNNETAQAADVVRETGSSFSGFRGAVGGVIRRASRKAFKKRAARRSSSKLLNKRETPIGQKPLSKEAESNCVGATAMVKVARGQKSKSFMKPSGRVVLPL